LHCWLDVIAEYPRCATTAELSATDCIIATRPAAETAYEAIGRTCDGGYPLQLLLLVSNVLIRRCDEPLGPRSFLSSSLRIGVQRQPDASGHSLE